MVFSLSVAPGSDEGSFWDVRQYDDQHKEHDGGDAQKLCMLTNPPPHPFLKIILMTALFFD